ncbi:uncharacterized protein LOC131842315 [Achroia grisella]|uniref:uncharacterized protein LOC131842315 n=1 Tax=Achroia grisella TaxID=688607 RepID=UPI0027D266A9|nr:uncharacterized protein LOC131842315 [Achroia grisella]
MESVLQPPQPFLFENDLVNVTSGNLSREWEKWKKSFLIYFEACELSKKEKKVQINILLHIIGEKCREIYDQFTETFKTIEEVIQKFDDFFLPKKNLTIERHRFFTRNQQDTETVTQYVFELNKMAAKCEFKDLCSDLVRDRLICGIKDAAMRERLLREYNLTLEKAVDICRLAEVSHAQAEHIETKNPEYHVHDVKNNNNEHWRERTDIHWINRGSSRTRANRGVRRIPSDRRSGHVPTSSHGVKTNRFSSNSECNRCGRIHNRYKCPAYGQKCNKCSRMNHFSRMCRIFEVLEEDSTDQAYSGDSIKVIGKCYYKVTHKQNNYILKFIIVDVDSSAILGRNSCEELQLIKRIMSVSTEDSNNKILNKYLDVFTGLGCLPGKYKIKLHKNISPVVHAPRKLPIALKENVKNTLLEMVNDGIIAKVEGPTDWVNSMTVVKKASGDLRICLDPRDLNKAIRREHFKLPTFEEITSNLCGAKFFTTLDAKQSFWQVMLHEDSTDLCTFNTPFGRYKFLRMPFGISSASEIFHNRLYNHFDDIEGVILFVDDLLVYGETKEVHDIRLEKKTSLLRELLKKEIVWHWDDRHEQCFSNIKQCLIRPPVLQYYNLNKPVTISVDASKNGLGACLLQNNLPHRVTGRALHSAVITWTCKRKCVQCLPATH